MKTHFKKMFDYDLFANELLLQAIIDTNTPAQPLKLMAHLLVAQLVWIDRCKGLPHHPHNLWPGGVTAEQCSQQIKSHHNAWINFLTGLNDADFNRIISYQNSRGDHYHTLLSDIIAHLINHGTHTRAQIGQQLKYGGLPTLPPTDYSYYLRQLNS